MIHFSTRSRGQTMKMQVKPEAAMDNFLAVLGLWRKPVARDGFCLFRAVSEQVYYTQTFHQKIYDLAKFYYDQWNTEDKEGHFWSEIDVIQTLSKIFSRDFIIYEVAGKPPVNATKNGYEKRVLLCRLEDSHLDCVYTKTYMQNAAICQSLVYEILYRGVFKLDTELDEAVQLIREQNKNKRNAGWESPSSGRFSDSPGSIASSNSSSSSEGRDQRYKDRLLKKTTPPLPYRIAKALDPLIYRNTELDIWEEDKREAIHREKFRHFTFSPGDKCQVILDSGPIYHGHIQEIRDKENPVVVYIEELGQKREIPLDCLRPTKATLRSDFVWKRYRGKSSNMPVAQVGSSIPNCPLPPPLPPSGPLEMSGPNTRPNNMMPLKQIQNTTHHTREILHMVSEVVHTGMPINGLPNPSMKPPQPPPHPQSTYLVSQPPPPMAPLNGSLPLMNGPLHGPLQKGPIYNTSPQQALVPHHMAPPPQSTEIQVVSPGGSPSYPCIWVPYMDTTSLRQVNVNMPPSQDPLGQDLPFTETQTMRFFYNLGVEYYRSVSQMSCSMSVSNNPPQGQSGIVCQSKSAKPSGHYTTNKRTTAPPPQLNTSPKIHEECLFSPSEMDDKGSHTSTDSGCESESSATVSGSPGNNKNGGSMTLSKESVATGKLSVTKESNLEKISACSDMSLSESTDGSVTTDQEQNTGRRRRKYYMYGDLKLVKPIKDIPKRFLNMLAATSAERARCEGEPIVLASPPVPSGGENLGENQNSQYLYSGHQASADNCSVSSDGFNTGGSGQSVVSSTDTRLSSACQANYQALYIPPQSSLHCIQSPACSIGDSSSCTHPPFYTGYSNASFSPQVGTVYFTEQPCPTGMQSGY